MFYLVSSADAAFLPLSVQILQEGSSCNLKEVSTSEVPVWLLNHSKQHDNSEQPLARIFVSCVRLQNLKNCLAFWEWKGSCHNHHPSFSTLLQQLLVFSHPNVSLCSDVGSSVPTVRSSSISPLVPPCYTTSNLVKSQLNNVRVKRVYLSSYLPIN